MKTKSSNNKNNTDRSPKQAIRAFVVLMVVLFILSGFEHYEKTGRIGMSAAYIVIALIAFGWVILSYLDDRRERIRKEKLEEAERIAEILSAPLAKFNDEERAAYEKALDTLEKKYKE